MSSVRAKLRLAWRMAAVVTTTVAYFCAMTLQGWIWRREPRIDLINRWVPRWSKALLWIFRIRVHKQGPAIGQGQLYPGKGDSGVGRIFVANHRSSLDIPLMLAHVAGHAISRHDLADWPLFGPLGKTIGTLYVDRSSRRSGAAVLGEVGEALARGEGVLMFPEGTSHLGDEVHPFRPGAFKAAERAGAEIVPLGIAYEDDAAHYYHEKFLVHLKRVALRPRLEVALVAGDPVPPSEATTVEVRDLVQGKVEQLVSEARNVLQERAPVKPESAIGHPTAFAAEDS